MSKHELIDLIKGCNEGNQSAFDTLYTELTPFLSHYVLGFVHCSALSSEVLQESFIQIWQSAAHYNPDRGHPLSWIFTIVRSRAVDKIRMEHKHRVGRRFCLDNMEIENIVGKEQPEADLVQQQDKSLINRHISELPPNQHLAITLAYVHGYSRQELSQALNANLNTVKSWLHRGVQYLKSVDEMAA